MEQRNEHAIVGGDLFAPTPKYQIQICSWVTQMAYCPIHPVRGERIIAVVHHSPNAPALIAAAIAMAATFAHSLYIEARKVRRSYHYDYLISDSSTPFVSRARSALTPLIAQAMAT